MTPNPDCTNAAEHTPQPEGYAAWHAWAARMAAKHSQKRCPECGLWNIWTPRVLRALSSRGRSDPQGKDL